MPSTVCPAALAKPSLPLLWPEALQICYQFFSCPAATPSCFAMQGYNCADMYSPAAALRHDMQISSPLAGTTWPWAAPK